MGPESIRVLLVGLDPSDSLGINAILAEAVAGEDAPAGYEFIEAASIGEARRFLTGGQCDAVVIEPPSADGKEFEILQQARSLALGIPILLIWDGHGSDEEALDLLQELMPVVLLRRDDLSSSLPAALFQAVESRRSRATAGLQERQQALVAEFGRRALAGEDAGALMTAAVDGIVRCLDVEFSKVLELHPQEDRLLLKAGYGWEEGLVGQATVGTDRDSQAGYTLLMNAAVIVEDFRTETRFRGPMLLLDHNVVSGVSVPIVGPSQPYGVLGAHTSGKRAFSAEDANFLQSVANILGAAIERERADRALWESESRYRLLLEQAPDGIFICDLKGNFVTVNAKACELSGYSEADLLAMEVEDLIAVQDLRNNPQRWEALLAGKRVPFEQSLRRKDGLLLPVEVSARRLDADHIQGIVRDISQRVEAENALSESQERFRRAFDDASIGMALVGLDGRLLRVNQALCSILGHTREELEATTVWEITHPDDRELEGAYKREMEADRLQLYKIEKRYFHADGHIVWGQLSVSAVRDSRRNILYYIGQLEDISARKKAQESLRRQLDELTVLHAVAQAGAEATRVDDLIARATEIIRETLYPDNFGVLLLDASREALYLHPSYHLGGAPAPQQFIPLGQGVSGQVAQTGKPRRVPDVAQEPAYIELAPDIRSQMCVPVRVGERVIGVINAESRQLDAFAEADERLLTTLAGQLATAIEKVRLFEAEREQRNLAESLRRVGLALNSTLELPDLLNLICMESSALFDVDAAYIWLVQGDGLVGFAGYGHGTEQFIGRRVSLSDLSYLGARVVVEKQAIFVNDAPESSEVNPELVEIFQAESILGVPLIKGEGAIGVLMIIATKRQRLFSPADIETAMLLGGQAAIAIENVRLLEEERRRRQEAETFRRAAEGITSTLDLSQVLDRILLHLEQVVPYDSACIFLVEEDRLHAVAGRNFPEQEKVIGCRYPLEEDGLHVDIFRAGCPLIIGDVRADPRFKGWGGTGYVRGWMGLPLIVRGTVIGCLTIDSRQVGAYGEREADLAQALAQQAAMAIDNASLFEESHRQARELLGLYDSALATSSVLVMEALLARLREQIMQLLSPDSIGVFLFDSEADEYEVGLAVEKGQEINELVGARFPVDEGGLTGWVIRSRRPLLVDDLLADPPPVKPRHITRPARSWLGVPLIARDRLIGVISLQSFQPNAFTNGDRRFLESLAAQVAIALENARLYEQARLEVKRRETLNYIVAAAAAATELDDLLTTVLDQVLLVLGLGAGGIWVREHFITRELPEKFITRIQQVAEEADLDILTFQGPVVIADWRKLDDSPALTGFAPLLESVGIRSTLAVPIRSDGQQIGSMALGARERRVWSPDEITLVETIGSQVGAAVERLRLFEETHRRLREVTLLSRVINLTVAADDMSSAFTRVCEEVANFFKVQQSAFALIDPKGNVAEVIAEYHDPDRPSALGIIIPIQGNPSMAYILEHRTPLAVSDAQADPRLAAVREVMREREVASILLVPVMVGDEVVGTLGFDDLQPREFTREDIALVTNVATQVSQALERMRMFANTQAHNQMMSRLATLSEALNRAFTEAEVLEVIGQGTYVLGSADRAAVYTRAGDEVRCDWARGLSKRYLDGVTSRFKEVPGGEMIQNREPILMGDLDELPAESPLRLLAKEESVQAIGLWPLVYKGEAIAAIGAYYELPYNWSEAEREVMSAFARQAAVALENARLFTAERRSKEQLSRSNALITALGRVAASIETARDPAEVMRTVGSELDTLKIRCLVALMEADSQTLVAHYTSIQPEKIAEVEDLIGLKFQETGLTPENFQIYAEMVVERRAVFLPDSFSLAAPLIPDGSPDVLTRTLEMVHIRRGTPIIFVPLTVDERVIGAFGMWGDELQAEDVTAVSIFASQLAVGLENARLYEAERRRSAGLEALRQASLRLTSSLELQPVLEAILDQALKLVSADDAHVFLYDGSRLAFGAALWAGTRQHSPYSEPRENGITYAVARGGKRLVISNVNQDPLFEGYRWGGAIVGLPLRKGDQVLGVMNIAFHEPHEFAGEDLQVLELLADQAAIALDNARLFEALQARLAELSVIAESSASLRGAANAQEIGQTLADQAVRLVQADAAWLSLIDSGQEELIPVGMVGLPPETGEYFHGVSEGIAGQVIRSNQPYRSPDVSTDPYTTFNHLLEGLGPGLCVPLRTSPGEVVGTLLVARRKEKTGAPAPFSPQAERLLTTLAEIAGNALQRAHTFEELELAYLETVLSLAKAMDARDSYTSDHSQRLAIWAEAVARELGCGDSDIQAILWAALLHDIGKIGVPDHILRKPGLLTEEEWEIMKRHPQIGAEIVAPVKNLADVAPLIRAHQERYDGEGYPDGLRGEQIPLGARILAVVDAYSAITDDRVYRKARSHQEAVEELQRCAGTQFDPDVVAAFLQVRERGLGVPLEREDPARRAIRAHTTGRLSFDDGPGES